MLWLQFVVAFGWWVALACGCSDFALNTSVCASANVVSARTLDQTNDMQTVLEVIPRGTVFHEPPKASTVAEFGWTSAPPVGAPVAASTATSAHQDFSWKSKFGFVALNVVGMNFAIDGLNEKGLSASWLHLSESRFPVPDKTKPVVTSICSYLLGNFARVADLRSSLNDPHVKFQFGDFDGKFVTLGDPNGQLALGQASFHVAVHDAKGEHLVIEFVDGKLKALDNPNGVLTNDPPLEMQLQELQENGFVNIPGGYGSQERFIRLSILNRVQGASCVQDSSSSPSPLPATSMTPPATTSSSNLSYLTATEEQQVITRALRLLQTVVQPTMDHDPTQWSIIRDHQRKKLYFQTLQNQLLRVVDLNVLNFNDLASRRLLNVVSDKRIWCINETPGLLDAANHQQTRDIPPVDQIKRLQANVQLEMIQQLSEPAPDSTDVGGMQFDLDGDTTTGFDDAQAGTSTVVFLAGGLTGVLLALLVNFFSQGRPSHHGYLPVK